jgi:hypothetical protein
MGIGIVVHGVIVAPGWANQEPSLRVHRHNRRVIRALPESDAEWPFLTRSMFSFVRLRKTFAHQTPQYEHALIHFAGDYKNMFVLEAAWIRKFEALLAKLCWYEAFVYHEWLKIRYHWAAQWTSESFLSNPPLPPSRWELKCHEMAGSEVPYAQAIEGPYSPRR